MEHKAVKGMTLPWTVDSLAVVDGIVDCYVSLQGNANLKNGSDFRYFHFTLQAFDSPS